MLDLCAAVRAHAGQIPSPENPRCKPKPYAAQSATTPLAPFSFERREPTAHDVAIDILFCGVCHSDLHTARGEWDGVKFPSVPGHEIVGRVTAVGDHVKGFKEGDLVGVGCMVDSCQVCNPCKEGLENYCEKGMTGTYNGPTQDTGENTYGGYSDKIVVREEFVLRVPEGLDPAAAAPLLCAGITTYSPLRHWNVQARPEGRRRRPRRPRPHGAEAGPRHGRGSHPLHHLARQGSGRQAARRRACGHLQGRRGDEG